MSYKVPNEGPIASINSSSPNSENDNIFIKELNKLHVASDQVKLHSIIFFTFCWNTLIKWSLFLVS